MSAPAPLSRLPLAGFARHSLSPPQRFGFARRLGACAVNDTEYRLTAHHLPLAVRLEAGEPTLVACLADADLQTPAIDDEGRWRPAYLPIALRTHPFVLSGREAVRPIDELDVLLDGERIGTQGAPICLDPAEGVLGPEIMAIRNTLLMMRAGRARLSRALELLRIADMLVPLGDECGGERDEWTVDHVRFTQLGTRAAAALAAPSFLPLDLASALLFSRRHLRPERLPSAPVRSIGPAPSAPPGGDPMDFMLANLEAMDFALDASELFDLGDVRLGAEFAPPEPPEELAA